MISLRRGLIPLFLCILLGHISLYNCQTVADPCVTLSTFSGNISGNFEPELCWRITPSISPGYQALGMTISFSSFNLGSNNLYVYIGDTVSTSGLVGDFSRDINPGTIPIDGTRLFVYLTGSDACSFSLEYTTKPVKELKPAILVLIAVLVALLIPAIFIWISLCLRSKKLKQIQLVDPTFGKNQQIVAFVLGIIFAAIFFVLILTRRIGVGAPESMS
eukprot:TRINITY_DN566_c0_g1_i2.p1 TRINITY_DN566_c0_g1~~TRINITY_DN566_c0_g1_i2.p1  ORF type:complete len:237 (-),score=46.86 TRINITY_DN566_c0_g1_i2:113-766(-)